MSMASLSLYNGQASKEYNSLHSFHFNLYDPITVDFHAGRRIESSKFPIYVNLSGFKYGAYKCHLQT